MLAIVPSRWTSASSPRSSPSPTTARSRRPPAPCSRCSPTSRATSPGWRRSSARARRPGPGRAHRRRRAGGRAGQADPARAGRHRRRRRPGRRRRHRRRPPRHARHDGPLAAAAAAVGARPRHPNVRAIVSEGSTSALIPGLLTGRFNAAIIHLPVDDPELTLEPLFAEDLLLRRPRRPPAGRARRAVAAPTSATHRLLLPPAGSALRRVLDRAASSRRRAAAGPGRDRRRAPAGHAGPRRLRRGDRAGDGRPPARRRRRPGLRVPELPPRVVALAHHGGRRRARPRGRCSTCCGRCSPHVPTPSPACGSGPPPSRSRALADRSALSARTRGICRKPVTPDVVGAVFVASSSDCRAARRKVSPMQSSRRIHVAWRASAAAALAAMVVVGGTGLAGAADRPPADDSPGSTASVHDDHGRGRGRPNASSTAAADLVGAAPVGIGRGRPAPRWQRVEGHLV